MTGVQTCALPISALFFLQRIRDEAHRFAINAHRTKRKKGISKSMLDQIDGIGSIRKRALLNHFGSARAVESASFDEIRSVKGVEEKIAKNKNKGKTTKLSHRHKLYTQQFFLYLHID